MNTIEEAIAVFNNLSKADQMVFLVKMGTIALVHLDRTNVCDTCHFRDFETEQMPCNSCRIIGRNFTPKREGEPS